MTKNNNGHKTTTSLSVSEERSPNLPERSKKESMHSYKPSNHHNRETHGLSNDIDENTSIEDVRAPNVFERAKEEFQALAEVFHHKKKTPTCDIRDEDEDHMVESSNHKQESPSTPSVAETKEKTANIFVRAKEEIKAITHRDKSQHHHHKETHGRNGDINEHTRTNEVKGPNVYERVKEEFEAVFQAMHLPKKES